MKIVFLATHYSPDIHGGAEISTQLIAESLSKLGVEIVVICTRRNRKFGEEWINGIRLRTIPIANLYHAPATPPPSIFQKAGWHFFDRHNYTMANRVFRILQEEQPDLLHSHSISGFSPAVWSSAIRLGIPVVHTLRSYYLLCLNETMRRNQSNCTTRCSTCRMLTGVKRRQSNLIQGVIGISQHILDEHLAAGYFQASNACVINNPIHFSTSNSTLEHLPFKQIQTLTDKQHNKLRLGFLGRIHESKGLETTLADLRQIPNELYEFTVGGTGDPSYVSKLRALAEGLPVHFVGHVNPDHFLTQTDLLLVPSLWNEPFGRVTIEAFSHGIPVIGSNRGGTAELISHGRTGMLFNPDAPGELAGILRHLASDPPLILQMGIEAKNESQKYTPHFVAQKHLNYYKQLIFSKLNHS